MSDDISPALVEATARAEWAADMSGSHAYASWEETPPYLRQAYEDRARAGLGVVVPLVRQQVAQEVEAELFGDALRNEGTPYDSLGGAIQIVRKYAKEPSESYARTCADRDAYANEADELRTQLRLTEEALTEARRERDTLREVARSNKRHVAILAAIIEQVGARIADWRSMDPAASLDAGEVVAELSDTLNADALPAQLDDVDIVVWALFRTMYHQEPPKPAAEFPEYSPFLSQARAVLDALAVAGRLAAVDAGTAVPETSPSGPQEGAAVWVSRHVEFPKTLIPLDEPNERNERRRGRG